MQLHEEITSDRESPKHRQQQKLSIEVAVGPLAIFLITSTDPVVILRHPYNRMINWQAVISENSFSYWVLKPNHRLDEIQDLQEQQGDSFNVNLYCDHVSLFSEQVKEIEHVVRSYAEYNKSGALPHLPGAPEHLKAGDIDDEDEDDADERKRLEGQPVSYPESDGEDTETLPDRSPTKGDAVRNHRSSISAMFLGLTGFVGKRGGSSEDTLIGSGLTKANRNGELEGNSSFGDDAAAVSGSTFRSLY